jgi:hypothetical protein
LEKHLECALRYTWVRWSERSEIMTVSSWRLNSSTSLKRAFQGEIPCEENVQDLKDDMEAARLLSFAKLPDK